MGAWYTTREAVKADLDFKETARANALVDRAIEGASRSAEGLLHRAHFHPVVTTRYTDWPNDQYARPYRIWLDEFCLVSITTLASGGVTIAPADYFLYPNEGPPYTELQLDLSSSSAFGDSATPQRSIAITGLWAWTNDELAAGTITDAVNDSLGTINVSDSSALGVGSIVRIDTERLVVTGKSMVDTTQNLGVSLGANVSEQVVGVQSGATFSEDEVIMIDAEKMLIIEIAGNNLIVRRAWDGSAVAAHTAPADIYAPRQLHVRRGVFGTTAASHLDNAPMYVWEVPGLLEELVAAEAINTILQKRAGYVRIAGSGDNAREARAAELDKLRAKAQLVYGREVRSGVI